MNEIICPHCNKAFKVDEAGYADILKQVRDHEFEQQLHDRLELAEKDKQSAVEIATARVTREMEKAASTKDNEIEKLKAKIDAGEVEQKLAVTEALKAVEKERDALTNELEKVKRDNEAETKLTEAQRSKQLQETAAAKDAEIQALKAELKANDDAQKLAVNQAVGVVEKERDKLKHSLEQAELQKKLGEQSLRTCTKSRLSPASACGP